MEGEGKSDIYIGPNNVKHYYAMKKLNQSESEKLVSSLDKPVISRFIRKCISIHTWHNYPLFRK